ncbi:AraC family transcriptional regulator [Olivibacter domesticus]|uniref:AraC-type DNA-binding protein n=1 Tax=Olivibacter domesticus TaxID=407022 RepID=A0A1H7QYC8_OLID1|nr:helix-turn-helix transcriptional regulator [Olivibacter domesticus]SEL52655.1 AraC-type DNA-binding protein [Olivibacter domesticus]
MGGTLRKLAVIDDKGLHAVSTIIEKQAYFTQPVIEENFTVVYHKNQPIPEFTSLDDHFVLAISFNRTGLLVTNDFSLKLVANSLYLIKPTSIDVVKDLSENFGCCLIIFRKGFLSKELMQEPFIESLMWTNLDEPAACKPDKRGFSVIRNLFKRLVYEYRRDQLFRDKMLKLLFVELLFEISRNSTYVSVRTIAPPSHQQLMVNKFKKLIDEHFLTKRTVQGYADSLFITAKHLSEVVKEYTGMTALDLIHKRLFQEARHWLSTPGLSVKEIAGKLNFDTSSHFSRFFKHIAGYSPTEFQRMYGVLA